MTTLKEQNLDKYFDAIAKTSGHGHLARLLLMREFDGIGYNVQLAMSGISAARYVQIVSDCQLAFKAVAGMPFHDYMSKKAPVRQDYSGPKPQKAHTHLQRIDALGKIYGIADRYLTDEELFCVCAIDLFSSRHRCELDDLHTKLGKNVFTTKGIYRRAKKKLIAALTREAPELASHPFLDRKTPSHQRLAQSTDDYRSNFDGISTKGINLKDPFVSRLYFISDTLFAPDQHALFCYAYLVDGGANRAKLNEKQRRNAVKLAAKISKAVEFEPHTDRLKVLLKHEDASVIRASDHLECIDETRMHTDLPFVELFYSILLNKARHGETTAFALTRLYRAEYKHSANGASMKTGIDAAAIRTYVGDAKGILKSELERLNHPLKGHPFLKNHMLANVDDDLEALFHLRIGRCFDADFDTLNQSDQYIVKIARTMFNAREFYILFASNFSPNRHKQSDIAVKVGVSGDHVGTILARAQSNLLEAISYEDRGLLRSSEFISKMAALGKHVPYDLSHFDLE